MKDSLLDERKIFLPLCCFCICLASISLTVRAQSISAKPNIILILTDDLGYGDLGVFFQNQRQKSGDRSKPFVITPNLDILAKQGAQFTQQYCNAPVCAPSRASLLTGVNQGNAHVRDNQFDKALENNHTIATVLKGGDYHSAAIGKWGLQGEEEKAPHWPAHPLKRGFDRFFGYMRHRDGHEHYPFEGLYRGKKEVWNNYKNMSDQLSKCYTTDLWTAFAKNWIINHAKKDSLTPFFMYLAYDAPHAVLELPTQAYPRGSGSNGGLQWLNKPGEMINTASGNIDSYLYPEYANATYDHDSNAVTPEVAWPETYKRYATATRRIDDAIGDLMQLLRDLNIDKNTLVVFTSDNGPSMESYLPPTFVENTPTFFDSYGPFDGIKRDLWEGGVRMPTIAAWPGHISAGKVINEPSMLSDWLATFADAAGILAPARTTGISLLPSLTGKGIQEKSLVYIEYYENGQSPDFTNFEASRRGRKRNQMQLIRFDDLVGVRYSVTSASDDFEIYDVVKDPKQMRNLATSAGLESTQLAMKAKVLQLRRADSAARRPYDEALIPGVTVMDNVRKGLTWKHFGGSFPWVVSEKGLNPQQRGISNLIQIKSRTNNGMILAEGFIRIPADGRYTFSFQSPGKAFVRLHDAILFDADFGYVPNTLQEHHVFLKAGFHAVSIYLLPTKKRESVSMRWKLESASVWTDLGSGDLFHSVSK